MARKNLPTKNIFIGRTILEFVLDEEIGYGHIGVVYKAHHKDIESLIEAIKIIPISNLKANWAIEVRKAGLLIGIQQIIQYQKHGTVKIDGVEYVCIFWEYIQGKNLRDYAKAYPKSINLPFIEGLLKEMLIAFNAMKARGITHDDIHEGNILVNDSDNRFITEETRFKISDFGIGGSLNSLKPKDDYVQLASICYNLLIKYVDPSRLDGQSKELFDTITQEFLTKRILESNPVAGNYVKNPKELLRYLEVIKKHPQRPSESRPMTKLKHPFDYLSCENIGNDFVLLQRLYSENFPGYDELLLRNNTILTGPRGCGKTTIFKNLGLKTRLLSQGNQGAKNVDFIGIYYYCGDLFFAFPYQKENVNEKQRRVIVHYFNLAILMEVLDTINIANRYPSFKLSDNEIFILQTYLKTWISDYVLPPQGTDALSHMLAFVASEKQAVKSKLTRSSTLYDGKMLPLDFIPNLSKTLHENISWFKNRPIFFMIDDYSLPKISRSLQSSLNDFLLGRYQECIFKISTESVSTFHPYDSNNKLLEETREYDVIDLGDYFLHAKKSVKQEFLRTVINNRLKNSEMVHPNYHDVATIMGKSHYKSDNSLALEIRQAAAGSHTYYYGWDIISELCSGDIAHMLRLIRDIFTTAGGYSKFSSSDVKIPLDKVIQHHAIRELGNEFLTLVESFPETGKDLRQIAQAFGSLANWYLRNRNSKNQTNNPPWQAFKIEIRDTPYFENEMLKRKYDDLLRCAVFLRDVSGKSQRGAVVPRLYLRRLLLPTFLLTPSQRDNIGLEVDEFFLLLENPSEFLEKMKRKKQKTGNQGMLL